MKNLLIALTALTIGTTALTTAGNLNSTLSDINDINTGKMLLLKNATRYNGTNYIYYNDYHNIEFNIGISNTTLSVWAVTPIKKLYDKIQVDIDTFKFISTTTTKVSSYIINTLANNISTLIKIPGALTSYGVIADFWNDDFSSYPQYSPVGTDANIIEKDYRFLAHDQLKVGISRYNWEQIRATGGKVEQIIFQIISDFPQWDASGLFGYISNDDLHTLSKTIMNHFDEAAEKFKNSDIGWKLVTNTEGDWEGFQAE